MFGDNLKKYRVEAGLSQSGLAEKLYVTRQCVSKWEKGVTQPDLETLKNISEVLNVSADVLLENSGERESPAVKPVNKILFLTCTVYSVFIAAAILILLRFLPDTIPAHYTGGKIDRYGSKAEVLYHLISVAVFAAVDALIYFTLKKDGGTKTCAFSHGVMLFILTAYLIFLAVLYFGYLTSAASFLTCLSSVILLTVSVVMHPKLNKPNWFLGVRLKSTLNNPVIWNKANAFACYLFSAVSLIIFIIVMAVPFGLSYLTLLSYAPAAAAVAVYCKIIEAKTK